MKQYDARPVQLELPFEPPVEHCPSCNPSGDAQTDLFRSMCERHWREHCEAFDEAAFHADMKEAFEEGARQAEAASQYLGIGRIPGCFKACA